MARRIGDAIFIYPFVIAIIGVPLVFPDGRLPSRRFRWVVGITVANMVAWTVLGTWLPQRARDEDPFLVAIAPFISGVETFILFATLSSFGAAVLAVWLRFRRGDLVQRQQIKWLVAVVALAAVVMPASLLLTEANPALADALSSIAILAMFALPIVIGIAVLRYRLFEIDRIVSRTLSYALVTGVLAAAFLITNIALQAVVSGTTGGSTLAVAASTLVVAALFQPLRRRIQAPIDRRFSRARSDAELVVSRFAARTRDEVDLEHLHSSVVATVREAVHPAGAGLWLRGLG